MNVNGYGVTSIISGYGTQSTSQTSNKPFTIPVWGEDISKTPKTNKSKDYTITDYDPFKDMAETGKVELPGYIHTKTEPTRSDEEILKDLEELAQEHARTGQFQDSDIKFIALRDEYVSSVSPDREGILKKSVKEISGIFGTNSQDYRMSDSFKQIDSQRTHKLDEEEKEKELIDYLLEGLENKENDNNVSTNEGGNETQNVVLKGDTYEGLAQNGKIQYVHFFDPDSETKNEENRTPIMIYNRGILSQGPTEAELARIREVRATYNAAYDVAYGRKDLEETEAYNKVYDRLKNIAVD